MPIGRTEHRHRLISSISESGRSSVADWFFRTVLCLIVVTFLPIDTATAAEVIGIVTRVTDGDTIHVSVDRKVEKLRLHGIDAPEIGQVFGTEARSFARKLIEGQKLTVERISSDRYGRTLAIVRFPDGRTLNAEMVRQGYAWWSRRHAPDALELAEAEREARTRRRGLWRQEEQIPPWIWRARSDKFR